MIQKKAKPTRKKSPEVRYDFSQLQWLGGDLDKLKEHLIEHLDLITTYPEREAETLVRLISRRLEVHENEVIVTDGATGALHLIAMQSPNAVSLLLPPTNREFTHALERAGHTIRIQEGIKDLAKLELEGVDMVWLSNPNTPDGRFFSRRSLLTLLRDHPEVTVVLDLSLAGFVVEDNIKAIDIKKYPNLIVVSSFSRLYNIPGLRVGYMVATTDRITAFHRNYTPRCVGALALEASRYILLHPAQFTIPIRKWLRDSLDLADQLDKLEGVNVQYGTTPFFILSFEESNAKDVASYLLFEHQLKVGTAEDDLELAPNEIRITGLPNARANECLYDALVAYLQQQTNV